MGNFLRNGILLAVTFCFLPAIFRVECSQSIALPDVERLPDYFNQVSTNNEIPGLTEDQLKQLKFLYQTYSTTKDELTKQRKVLLDQFFAIVQTPLPSRDALIGKQVAINEKEDAVDDAAMLAAYQMRQVLRPDQIDALFLFDFAHEFPNATFSQAQKNDLNTIALLATPDKTNLNQKLNLFEYEREVLLNHVNLDQAAIMKKQDEINQVSGQLATNQLLLRIALRSVLDWQQKNQLFNMHKTNEFSAAGVSGAQDDKVMELHFKREGTADAAHKRLVELDSALMSNFEISPADQKVLVGIQKEIDKVADEARIRETEIVLEIREILTPEQRTKLVQILKNIDKGIVPPFPPEDQSHHHHMH